MVIESKENNKFRFLRFGLYFILLVCISYIFYDIFLGRRDTGPGNQQKFVVTGHNKLTKEEIMKILDIQKEIGIQDISFRQLSDKLKHHPRILDAAITRRSKDQILINIIEKRAIYIVHTPLGIFELDDKFKIISEGEIRNTELVVISGDFSFDSKNRIESKFIEFAKIFKVFLNSFPELQSRISEVHLSQNGEIYMYISRPVRLKVIMGNLINKKQIQKLYSVLAYFEHHKTTVNLLDLRGDDAIYY